MGKRRKTTVCSTGSWIAPLKWFAVGKKTCLFFTVPNEAPGDAPSGTEVINRNQQGTPVHISFNFIGKQWTVSVQLDFRCMRPKFCYTVGKNLSSTYACHTVVLSSLVHSGTPQSDDGMSSCAHNHTVSCTAPQRIQ